MFTGKLHKIVRKTTGIFRAAEPMSSAGYRRHEKGGKKKRKCHIGALKQRGCFVSNSLAFLSKMKRMFQETGCDNKITYSASRYWPLTGPQSAPLSFLPAFPPTRDCRVVEQAKSKSLVST